MRRVLTLAMVVLSLAGLQLSAQTATAAKPNFAGKWTLVSDGNAGSGMPSATDVAVAQDDKAVTVTQTTQQFGDFKAVYKLDGSDSPNTLSFNGNDMTLVSKAKWAENKLVIKTSFDMGGQSVETSMTISLDASGNLVLENVRPDYQGGGGNVTTKSVYKKKPMPPLNALPR